MSRRLYEDILMWEQLMDANKANPDFKPEIANEYLIELKRKARRANKNSENWFSAGETVIHNEMEFAIFKYALPEDIKTFEDADEYFREYEYIYFHPSPYDCTGQRFTSWYKIFQKPDGSFWVYHAVSMDV